MEAVRYAIVDGAVEEGLLEFLERTNPPHCCLYSEPIQPDLIKLAPYLIEVIPEVEIWLQNKENPWGIFLTTNTNMNKLRQHLRKNLQVLVPDQSKPVLFRFYDPRNIWDFLSVLSDWEKTLFIGPVNKISTFWSDKHREEDFSTLKTRYPEGVSTRRKMIKVSHTQMNTLNEIFEQRYINTISEKIKTWGEKPEKIDKIVIAQILHWLKSQNINDDRSTRGLFYLFYTKKCLSIDSMPEKFKAILCADSEEGVFKAETLLLQELGNIPL
jgi:hypothetical protein